MAIAPQPIITRLVLSGVPLSTGAGPNKGQFALPSLIHDVSY